MPSELTRLVRAASKEFEGTGVTVYAWNAHTALLEPIAANTISEQDGLAPRGLGVGAAGRAAQGNASVLIDQYVTHFGHATPAGRAGVHMAMGVPLLRSGQVRGAVSVGTDHPQRRFDPQALGWLEEVVRSLEFEAVGGTDWPLADSTARTVGLETLYRDHLRAAIGLAYRLLGDMRTAEDVAQDVFLALWRSGMAHDPRKGSTRTWILVMVRRRCVDLYRARMRRPTQQIDERVHERALSPDPTIQAHLAVDSEAVLLAVEQLPTEQRATLDLAYFAGLSHQEVAERLEVPLGTVKSRIRLALHRLRGSVPRHDSACCWDEG